MPLPSFRSVSFTVGLSQYTVVPKTTAGESAGHNSVSEFAAASIFERCLRSKNASGRTQLIALACKLSNQSTKANISMQAQAQLVKTLKRAVGKFGTYTLLKKQRYVHPPMASKDETEDEWVFEEDLKHWVEVQLVDEDNNPVAGVEYEIKLSDGSTRRSTTNSAGVLRYENLQQGLCEFCLIKSDEAVWTAA